MHCPFAGGGAAALPAHRSAPVELQLYPRRFSAQVETYAAEYDLDPLLIYTFIRTESSFKPDAVSPAWGPEG